MPHPIRETQRKNAERKASAQELVDHFTKHHPAELAKLRVESLEAANARGVERGWTTKQITDDAWRHLVSRLRYLKGEGSAS